MKRIGWLCELFGFAVTALGGTVLHFLYDWLGKPIWIAPFSGINESTWEHMKLLFWPVFIYALIQSIFFRSEAGFWCVKLKGTLIGLAMIPLLFYSYNGVIGKSPDWINIAIFFISAAILFIYQARANLNSPSCKAPRLALFTLCIIGIAFVVFTFFAPHLGIFRDPLTGSYGI